MVRRTVIMAQTFLNILRKSRTHANCMACINNSGQMKNLSRHYSGELTTTKFNGKIKEITMCDLKTRNALSINMMEKLIVDITADQDSADLRAIVISAQGPVFSAGHNLKELKLEHGKDQHKKVFSLATKLMSSIINCPVPVIAKVHGIAAAAGCQLVAQCDIAVCSEESQFSTPGANFGIFCSTPGVALARTVPKMVALHMLFTGNPISGRDAKDCGLVTKVFAKDNLDLEVDKICQAIITKSRAVITLGKRFYYKQINVDILKAYEMGAEQMVENVSLKDGQEGIQSFVEKRKPVWN